MATTSQCPFSKNSQLDHSLDDALHNLESATATPPLPGYPMIKLDQTQKIIDFLLEDLFCAKLARMADHLWLMSTHSHKNITPLHRQSLRGRRVVVMEDPGLHLVWIHDSIFIKPLPRYVLSHDFWNEYLLGRLSPSCDETPLVPSALGFLRTYLYLVKYESDFRIAQRDDLQLIPQGVTWDQFCDFCSAFGAISDDQVAKRYEYGELRLTRLNAWAVPLLRTMGYRYVGLQYSDYFAPYFAPLAFVFGVFAILLNAMQVGLAAEALDSQNWGPFREVCRWFSVVSIFVTIVPAMTLLLLLCHRIADEWIYALRQRYWQRSKRTKDQGAKGA